MTLAQGFLKEPEWTAPEGQERSRIECTADRMQFLAPKGEGGQKEPESDSVPF